MSSNNVEAAYPLSPMQQGMLFHSLVAPDSGFYITQFVYAIEHLNVAAFAHAWQRVVDRHAILRTAFAWERIEKPLQVVGRRVKLPLAQHDLRGLAPAEQDQQIATYLETERKRGFKLSQAPLMRLALFQLTDETYRFVWVYHHILLDGWSLPLVLQEVLAFYAAFCRGQDLDLKSPRPFREYIAWLQKQDLARAEAFWRRQLAGFRAPTALAVDRPADADAADASYAEQATALAPAVMAELQALARRQRLTLNTLVMGAWAILLSRYSGQDDILFGASASGRPADLPGVETMIGLFINTLPVRIRAPADAMLPAWLTEVQNQQVQLRQYEYSPLLEIQRWSEAPRDQPLFESLLAYENYPIDAALAERGAGLAIRELQSVQRVNYPLVVLAQPDATLTLRIYYDCRRFDAGAIGRMLGHLRTLLEGIAANAARRIGALPILTPAERRQILVEWNDTRTAAGAQGIAGRRAQDDFLCAQQLFAIQAERTPDATALVFQEQHLTYRELNRRANQLGRYLRACGAGPEALVAICLERSLDLVVGLMGVLKAGSAYVPLDPAYPRERLAFMLADSQPAALLVATAEIRGQGSGVGGQDNDKLVPDPRSLIPDPWTVVDLSADWPQIALHDGDNPADTVTAERAAYLIYTSGSTGAPKGVLVAHRGLPNLAAAQRNAFGVRADSRVLQFASFSFDASVFETLMALLSGACLCLGPRERLLAGPALHQLLRDQAITHVTLPPSALATLPDLPLPALGALIVAGEACPARLVTRWAPGRRFFNAYGPTEATVWATLDECDAGQPAPTIGRPIANAQIYLLDANMQPAPVGVPGELYIGGVGLARGYLNRPDLTAERFVPNPFAATMGDVATQSVETQYFASLPPHTRLYKTGDLARYRPDGSLEYLGRRDQQVKLRGYRIEPGEVAAALERHPDVQACIVTARTDTPDDPRLVAYIVEGPGFRGQGSDGPATDALISEPRSLIPELRAFLRERLPEYMLPAAYVPLDALPLTPSGKIDRHALPPPDERPAHETAYAEPRTAIERTIAGVWQAVLHVDQVGVRDNFFDLGGHSLHLLQVQSKLREALGRPIAAVDLFRYPTISALAAHLSPAAAAAPGPDAAKTTDAPAQAAAEIAIVGMSGRFPGADSIDAFWHNLRDGVESISFLSEQDLLAAGVGADLLSHPAYVKACGWLDNIEYFDAAFFGYTPREAEMIDPQQRLLLECAWQALEHAGYDAESYPGRIAVYAGAGLNQYMANLYSNRDLIENVGMIQTALGNEKDHVTTRVSYKLNLRGPSVSVQTACSTSLVAVHLACRSLLAGECAMALAGGVSLSAVRKTGYLYQEGGYVSPDGRCRAFDAQSQGTISSSGAGVVVLKRLADALADGDTIYATIKGSAINNDGSGKVGYTAPSVDGQAEVISAALAAAGVAPETIGYIEAHGTGTPLGDPIEVAALAHVFGGSGARSGGRPIGSLKTNIGHLDSAAGVAGLIKTILALQHRQIPPSLHFESPNPQIDFAGGALYVNADLADWPENGHPRRAGVSSFGIGGTNAHVVLEEAPPLAPAGPSRPWILLILSARTDMALESATERLIAHLKTHPDLDLADVAYTLQVGRRAFNRRRMLVCRDLDDAVLALEARDPQRVIDRVHEPADRPIAFMFPGGGAQYAAMAGDLYQNEPLFREQVDRCAALLDPRLGLDLREVLYGTKDEGRKTKDDASDSSFVLRPSSTNGVALERPSLALPALFVVEYALAQLWMSWGVRPNALIGHSVGEYVAATLAGVFTLEDALDLVTLRGRLFERLPEGAMLSVALPEDQLLPLLGADLSLAAVNGPALCVVSGGVDAIDRLYGRLSAQGVDVGRLHIAVAAHSALVAPILDAFGEFAATLSLQPPRIPYISNVTGTWISAAEATDPGYWVKHLRQTVRFAAGVQELLREPNRILLEVGPGQTLSTLARQQQAGAGRIALPSLRHPRDRQPDVAFLLNKVGQLWLAGAALDWNGFYHGERRRRLALPTYPFERQRYWIEPQSHADDGRPQPPAFHKRPDIADWFYAPAWTQATLPPPAESSAPDRQVGSWLIFVDPCDTGMRLIHKLEQAEQLVAQVSIGPQFAQIGERAYTLNPRRAEDYDALFQALSARDMLPGRIVHLWGVTPDSDPLTDLERLDRSQDLGFYSLLLLAQALGKQDIAAPIAIAVVTNNLHELAGEAAVCAEKATVLGPCAVIPHEYPNITCRSIDLVLPAPGSWQAERLVDDLMAELAAQAADPVVAYRHNHRWVRRFEPVRLNVATRSARLREAGVYLITGGLGGIGLVLAEQLAREVRARLVLLGRSALPERVRWDEWLENHDDHDRASNTIRQVRAIEALGAEVMLVSADVADEQQMRSAVAQARERFGAIHGVVHAAGVPAGGIIQLKAPDLADRVLAPKVRGTLILDAIFKEAQLDFFVLCSSLNALLGAIGQVDHCGANAFLDAFARRSASRPGNAVIAIDWPAWQEVGQVVNTAVPDELKAWRERNIAQGILSSEGVEVFRRILQNPLPQVIVSPRDFQTEIEQNAAFTAASYLKEIEQALLPRPAHPRPQLGTGYVAPYDGVEQVVAGIWQELLGIEQVGRHDDFFELGGHSLLATQLLSRMRDAFRIELPLQRLFETPTVAGVAALIARQPAAPSAAPTAIRPQPRTTNRFPLSFAQQRLWFLDQLAPGSPLYNVPAAVELTGRLDIAAMAHGLNAVVARHESLRTTFAFADGQPIQLIAPALSVPLPLIDLRSCPAEQRPAIIARLVVAEAQRPFDLARGPLIRAQLVRRAAGEHLLLIDIHHIVSDGWSMGVIVRELAAYYTAHLHGHPAALPDLPVQYADFTLWQREWLDGAVLEAQLAYWRGALAGCPPVLDLPTDRPRPSFQSFHGARQPITIPPALTAAVAEIGQRSGSTLFMTLLAAFQTLLFRYTAQSDLVVGSPIANRRHTEIEGLIGFFVNTLVLRTSLAGDPSFRTLLERVRAVVLDAYTHQDLPFEKLVEELKPVRDPSHHPLFQVMFVLQNAPTVALALPGLTLRTVAAYNETAKFDLWLGLGEDAGGLSGQFEYNTDLFDDATIARMRGHFLTLLAGIASDPDQRLADLPLLSRAERRQALAEWNDTFVGVRSQESGVGRSASHALLLHEIIAAQVARTPDAVAVIFEETRDQASAAGLQQLTYRDLNQRAQQVASHLRTLGVAAGQRVGICMDRSVEMVAGLLGILQAGAAYVPLDPALPPDRLTFMIADAQAPVLLTQSALRERLPQSQATTLCLDPGWEHALGAGAAGECSDVTADHLAYVIYTSGSTGSPKGVSMSHRALVNLLEWQLPYLGHRVGTRFLQFASLSFDVSYQEIFPTLASGGAIVLISEELRRDPPALWRLLVRERIERIYLPYVGLQQLAEAADQPGPAPRQLRQITVSGEQLQITQPIMRMIRRIDGCTLNNFYGPSESHAVTAQRLTGAPEDWPTLAPIGRPIANTQIYLLDQRLQPAPIGVPGELYIGGVCLADGYLGRPDLTAERFIPNPFGQGSGVRGQGSGVRGQDADPDPRSLIPDPRLYRTGDLARYRPDGSIVFLGRIDHQVKIRGFRVELDEVAAVLTQHPAVEECAVVVRADPPGDRRLVAYVVEGSGFRGQGSGGPAQDAPVPEPQSLIPELRAFLKERLPDYMIPAAFVVLDALPLTINRKVDHRALPAPEGSQRMLEEAYVAPQTPMEQDLAAIWAELLRVEQVGRHDNFFALGGHSLLATQMIGLVRQRMRLELPLRSLFAAPTLAELAEQLDGVRMAREQLHASYATLLDSGEEGEL